MKGKIVHIGQGLWGPHFEAPYAIVGSFLWGDVGRSTKVCDSYLDAGFDVAAGNKRTFEIQGNHIILRIMPTWVLLRDMFKTKEEGLEPAVISMDAYVSILRYWKSILASWDGLNLPTDSPEFTYDDPMPSPPMSPDEADRAFRAR
ncbi:MAG: hypothetical protein L0Y72_19480 [Gemmataceae bacterium]|nr:hypothetical protein [Gemmataceae bacterium]MCI0741218.1 hypothetical protein [Gemmataceae bacterium]